MKKNITMNFRYMILAVMLLALTACEDFLTRGPKDKLSPDTYFKTETECQLYTNNFYTILPVATDFYQEDDSLVCELYTSEPDQAAVFRISRIDKVDIKDLSASENIN